MPSSLSNFPARRCKFLYLARIIIRQLKRSNGLGGWKNVSECEGGGDLGKKGAS